MASAALTPADVELPQSRASDGLSSHAFGQPGLARRSEECDVSEKVYLCDTFTGVAKAHGLSRNPVSSPPQFSTSATAHEPAAAANAGEPALGPPGVRAATAP